MKLHLFTANYPYGFGESYLNNELKYVAPEIDEVIIYPVLQKGELQTQFNQAHKIHFIEDEKKDVSFLDHLTILGVLIHELVHAKQRWFVLKNLRKFRAELKHAMILAKKIETIKIDSKDIVYSYWMNEWALALALLKKRKKLNKFVFRVNGYDIWDERHAGNYLPFRHFIYSKTDAVIALSETTEKYLKSLNIYPEKITKCYFGTEDYGVCDTPEREELTVFSCSSAYPLKRLDKIAKVLVALDVPIHWTHHGDGETIPLVEDVLKNNEHKVRFTNTKKVNDYSEVLEMEKRIAPDLFINLSSTEGMPVTLLEALSYGIPILVNDVGSCKELINDVTGLCVNVDEHPEKIAHIIKDANLLKLDEQRRARIREYWMQNFYAKEIYGNFAKQLKSYFE